MKEMKTISFNGQQYEIVDGIARENINSLIGEDVNQTIRQIAENELLRCLVPADAKEALDTLEEIAAWIQAHPDSAAAMNETLIQLQQTINNISSLSNDEIDNAIKDI